MNGYIFDFGSHGAFEPNGRVNATGLDIEAHNRNLANEEWEAMLIRGKGLLYVSHGTVSDWPGVHSVRILSKRYSYHNMTGDNGRMDVWFHLDGHVWHGVNIGDNHILRVRRTKQKTRS